MRKGIRQRTDVVVMDARPGDRLAAWCWTCCTIRPGRALELACDWVVCAVPPEPEDGLWHALRRCAPFEVHRVGDCLAPRRAHAAVIEGDRVGVAL